MLSILASSDLFDLFTDLQKYIGDTEKLNFQTKKWILFSFLDLSKPNKTKGSAQTKSKYLIIKHWSAVTQVLHRCVISKKHHQQSYKTPPIMA